MSAPHLMLPMTVTSPYKKSRVDETSNRNELLVSGHESHVNGVSMLRNPVRHHLYGTHGIRRGTMMMDMDKMTTVELKDYVSRIADSGNFEEMKKTFIEYYGYEPKSSTTDDMKAKLQNCIDELLEIINEDSKTIPIEMIGGSTLNSVTKESSKNTEINVNDIVAKAPKGACVKKMISLASNNKVQSMISRFMAVSAVLETLYGKPMISFIDRKRVENYDPNSNHVAVATGVIQYLVDNKYLVPFIDIKGNVSSKSYTISCSCMAKFSGRKKIVYTKGTRNNKIYLSIDSESNKFTVQGKVFDLTRENCEIIDATYRIR